MSGRKKPMGQQAVPNWGLWPWMGIVHEESELNFTLKEVLENDEANRKAQEAQADDQD